MTVNASNGGNDTAYLADGPGTDDLVIMAGSTTLSGAGYVLQVGGFEIVNVASTGGRDRVSIFDSPGDDTFAADAGVASMAYPSGRVQLTGFGSATVFGTAGGANRRTVGTTSMSLDFRGVWTDA